jgi:hypothetical protein
MLLANLMAFFWRHHRHGSGRAVIWGMVRCAITTVFSFGIMLAIAAAIAVAIGWQAIIGFALGVTTRLAAAAIAGTADFE